MKSNMVIEQDGDQYRDVRIDFAPDNDFKKEVYSITLSLDKEFGMISESDWSHVLGEGKPATELSDDPPQAVIDAYATLRDQAESLAEKGQ